jgi:hypothetical protein
MYVIGYRPTQMLVLLPRLFLKNSSLSRVTLLGRGAATRKAELVRTGVKRVPVVMMRRRC